MESISYPTTVENVERLVLALYDPASINNVPEIQAALHQAQKSPQGWRLAHELLSRQDEKVRFFGVLTFIIKLNTESSSLGPNEANELRDTLLQWLITYARDNSSKLVLQKLSSVLVTFYLRFPERWPRPIHHVLSALVTGSVAAPASESTLSQLELPTQALGLGLMFTSDLAEEAVKIDTNSSSNFELVKGLSENVEDMYHLVMGGIKLHAKDTSANREIAEAAVKSLQSWVFIYAKSLSKTAQTRDMMRVLISMVLDMMSSSPLKYPVAMDFVVDLVGCGHDLPTPEHTEAMYKIVLGPIGQACYGSLVSGDFDFENVQYGQLVISLADMQVSELVTGTSPHVMQIFDILIGLLTSAGYPVVEDKLFVPLIELWCNIAETVGDEGLTTEDGASDNPVLKYLANAAQLVCGKIVIPPPDELSEWDSSEKDGFLSARRDVSDFLEAAYTPLGKELISFYGQAMLENLQTAQWRQVEAAAYCLGAFYFCLARDDSTDDIVASIFSDELFALLHPSNTDMPARCRQTCISLVERLSGYFQRHVDRLPSVLTVLFSVIGDSNLTTPAAKSIYELCDSCKEVLAPEAAGFIGQYSSMMQSQVVECITRERLTGAIACVLQAVTEESVQLQHVSQMIDVIESDISLGLRLVSSPDLWQVTNVTCCPGKCHADIEPKDYGSHVVVRALRSLLYLARDLHSATDCINLDNAPTVVSPELSVLQTRIMQTLVGVQQSFPLNSDVVEGVFQILRVGISETRPGPFVFPHSQVAEYIMSQTLNTPRVGLVIATACSLASSFSQHTQSNQEAIMTQLIAWVMGLITNLPDLDSDVDISQNAFQFLERTVNSVSSVKSLISCQPAASLEVLFRLGIEALYTKEPLVKTAALDFWASFFGHPTPLDPENLYRQAVDNIGPRLVTALLYNIGGNASRSELDRISLPIKKLFTTKPQAKAWFDAALSSSEFPSDKVTEAEKAMFVKKLVMSRGNRNTTTIIRDFWLACRGSQFAYVS